MKSSTRILVNTGASYMRLFIAAGASFVVTPIALRLLGASDYGVFSVIGGSLAILMFVNGALATGAQRHIAYALGRSDVADARKWLSASIIVHLALAAALAGLAFGGETWLITRVLHFPPDRLIAATWIYRMVIAAMLCNIIGTPHQAFLMAQEAIVPISAFAVLGAAEMLGGVALLSHVSGDRLIWYGGIYSASQIIMFVGPVLYCYAFHTECRGLTAVRPGRRDILELLGFSCWNLFGALGGIAGLQGPAVILNVMFGPVINAAYGLALQVNGFANNLSWGMLRATTSPIVKRHASGNNTAMAALTNLSNTCSFAALWILFAPVLLDMNACLALWLHKVPAYTAVFASLLLVALLIDQLTMGFGASLQATGRIAAYQMTVGLTNCAGVGACYLLLRFGFSPVAVVWVGLGTSVAAGIARLCYAHTLAGIPVLQWARRVLMPAISCVCASAVVVSVPMRYLNAGVPRLLVIGIINFAVTCGVLFAIGITAEQRQKASSLIGNLYQRFSPASARLA